MYDSELDFIGIHTYIYLLPFGMKTSLTTVVFLPMLMYIHELTV